ncbi:hypothetical protein H257_09441 [Aphanomyces astaci]|uniref:Uncharacterized protein n=1 Tax=Aphanomyces astaci TaxID=112090 RepID=W4GAT7_APHAT|nr:hypothetical protein H257_09441 [Aphanomyces astaci]ETV76411.1 hypothetical protein H257_09441 [Aphanomyces astaci]|eukprot:XP_009833956.1 hypothetical protein H257_09441 [Aphanomyces astaci]
MRMIMVPVRWWLRLDRLENGHDVHHVVFAPRFGIVVGRMRDVGRQCRTTRGQPRTRGICKSKSGLRVQVVWGGGDGLDVGHDMGGGAFLVVEARNCFGQTFGALETNRHARGRPSLMWQHLDGQRGVRRTGGANSMAAESAMVAPREHHAKRFKAQITVRVVCPQRFGHNRHPVHASAKPSSG